MGKFSVIIAAAGKSTRFHDKTKKQFADLDGRAVWLRSAELFINREDVCQTILVIPPADEAEFRRRFGANIAFMDVRVVPGGAKRTDSIAAALTSVSEEAAYIALHDAARPCLQAELVNSVFAAALQHGAAMPALRVTDSLKRLTPERTVETSVEDQDLWLSQTPQAFRKDILLRAYANRSRVKAAEPDDSQLVETIGQPVAVVEGPATNLKIVTKRDLVLAAAVLKSLPKPKPTGPLHPFSEEAMW